MNARRAALLGSVLVALLNTAAFAQSGDGYDTTLTHLTFSVQGQPVGIWTTSQLAVSGAVVASSGVQVGQTTAACSAALAGTVRFNTATNIFEGCNGTYWQAFSVPTTYSDVNTAAIYCPANKQAVAGGAICGNGVWANGGNHQPAITYSVPITASNGVLIGANPNGLTGNVGWFAVCGIDQGSSTVPSTIWVNCQ